MPGDDDATDPNLIGIKIICMNNLKTSREW